MNRRILVPLDGSALADRILPQVRRLLVAEDAHVILLAVVEGAQDAERRALEARDHLAGIRDQLVDAGASVEVEVRHGSPAKVIVERAAREDVSLVVMATHGRTGLSRVFRGSVAESVLRTCPAPLLLGNPHGLDAAGEATRVGKVLVPLDGSPLAEQILPLVTSVARRFDAEVLLLFCDWAPPMGALPIDASFMRSAKEIEAMLEPQRQALVKAGVRARSVAAYGPPVEAILDAAAREAVDLVAMSTHGHTGLARLVFGSVAEQVLRRCARPLLVRRAAPLEVRSAAPALA